MTQAEQSSRRGPYNVYTVNLQVRAENLTGNPRWKTVAEAIRQRVFDLPIGIPAGSGSVYITDVEIDRAEED